MSTHPEHPQGTPAPGDHQFDEHSGVYGFFRRNQKKLLYSAGLFTLLTFSITGPMTQLVRTLFDTREPLATITVNGNEVKLTQEDYRYGNRLAQNGRSLPPGVLPGFGGIIPGQGGESEMGECYAILRRAAIECGIGVSLVEVDKAIEVAREQRKADSASRVAQLSGFGSLAEFRQVVAEAMRVGTFMQLEMLALDTGDAEVMRKALEDREKIAFEVASYDVKARQAELEAATQLSDEDLRTWLDGKSDPEKGRLSVYDLPLVQLRMFAALTEEGQFDASQWQDTALKDFTVTEDELKSYYEQDKDTRFALETAGEYKPFEDEAVQAELNRVVQAQRVMNDLLGQARDQFTQALKPSTDAVAEKTQAFNAARDEEYSAKKLLALKEGELEAKQKELADKPEDEELKAAVAKLETEVNEARDKHTAAEPVLAAAQAALDEAKAAQDAARKAFDLGAALTELTKDKSGFVVKTMTGLKNAEALADLDALELGLGKWPTAAQGAALANPGDLCQGPVRTQKAVMVYQAIATDPKPLKPWDVLKPLLDDAYWVEQANKEGVEKQKAMNAALLRLAKEQMPDFVTEKESKRQERIDAKITEWEQGVNKDIEQATEMLARPNLGSQARGDWQRKLDTKTRDLGMRDMRVTQFTSAVQREIDNEIAEEAKKHYQKVLAAAAAEAGFTVRKLDPLPRDVQRRPRFDQRFDATTRYVIKQHSQMKEGEASAVMFDSPERCYHVTVCTAVAPLTADDITRREFMMVRGSKQMPFARLQMFGALQQAFSLEMLKGRYAFDPKKGTQTEPQPQ
ncbi:MAG: hypothetical protein H6835_00315 [Planctomycetes bacterium]|nr:hypothetical protein [Planctomycetota bacterium]